MHKRIADEELAIIESLAKKATPGPWFFAYNKVWSKPILREYDRIDDTIPDDAPDDDPRWATMPDPVLASVPAVSGDTPTEAGRRDGEFIASLSPERALSLIERLRAAEAERDRLQAALRESRLGARPNVFGQVLREHRTAAGLSLSQVAKAIGIGKVYLGEVERGERGPLVRERWAALIQVLPTLNMRMLEGASSGELFGNSGELAKEEA